MMAAGNIIVTQTINKVIWDVDKNSYARALRAIRSTKSAWEKAGADIHRIQDRINRVQPLAGIGGYGARSRTGSAGSRLERQQRERIRLEQQARRTRIRQEIRNQRQLATIRAKAIRFNSGLTSLNLSHQQRMQAISDFGNLTRQYRAGSLALSEYNARTAVLHNRLRQQGGLVRRAANAPMGNITGINTGMLGGMGSIVAGAVGISTAEKIRDTGAQFQNMTKMLTAATGSMQEAKEEMKFLETESVRLGLDMKGLAKQYAGVFMAAKGKLDKTQIHDLFTALGEYSVVTGADPNEQSRVFYALKQALGKGKLSSEEVLRQMGDSLTGSMQLFTEAYRQMKKDNKLTEKDFLAAMQTGNIMTADILPYFTKALSQRANSGGALEKAIRENNSVALARMKTKTDLGANKMFIAGYGDALTRVFNKLGDAIESNGAALDKLGYSAGRFIDGAMDGAEFIGKSLSKIGSGIDSISNALGFEKTNFKEIFGDVSYLAGIGVVAGAVWSLAKAVRFLIGFANPLKGILTSLAGIAGIRSLAGAAAAASTGVAGGLAAGIARVASGVVLYTAATTASAGLTNMQEGAARANMPIGEYAVQQIRDRESNATPFIDLDNIKKSIFGDGPILRAGNEGIFNNRKMISYHSSDYMPGSNLNNRMDINVNVTGEAKIQLDNQLNVNDGAVTGLITNAISNQKTTTLNMLLGGGVE